MIYAEDERQLELLLEEAGLNTANIARLEREAKQRDPVQPFSFKPKPVDPWPAHMRFD